MSEINDADDTGEDTEAFSVRAAHAIVRDLFSPNPWIFWTDFLATTAIAYGATVCYLLTEATRPLAVVAFLVAGFALFRDGIFIHEIAHLRSGELRAFRIGWNVIFGITSLTPSFMYSNHADHHKRDTYGTRQDGEYLPLGNGPRRQLVAYFLQVPALPFLALVRFMILTPLSLLHPRMRRWVLERASSYAISPWYRRTLRVGERRGLWIVTELVIFVGLTTLALLVANGTLRWQLIAKFYFLATFGIGLNWIRNTGAHRYRNRGGKLSYDAQLADSINVVGPRPLVDLMFPIGLRYHALHHLFPTLPYHALDEAHRRLMARLPADSPYRKTVQPSYFAAVTELWRGARAFDRQAGSGPAEDGRSSPAR